MLQLDSTAAAAASKTTMPATTTSAILDVFTTVPC
jgi:hypothetical protein